MIVRPHVQPVGYGVSRRFTDASTTEGLTSVADTRYADMTGAFSLAVWVYRRATPAGNRTFITSSTATGGWNVTIRTANEIRFSSNLTTVKARESSSTPTLNAWTLLGIRDTSLGTTGGTLIDFNFNGVTEAGVAVGDGTGTKATGTARPFLIANSGQAPPFDIGPVAVWERKLGDNEFRQLYLGADPRDFGGSLVGFWAMDGRAGNGLEPDLSGRGLPLFSRSTGIQLWGPPIPRPIRIRPKSRVNYVPAAGSGTTVTPGVGQVDVTGFAPTVFTPTLAITTGPASGAKVTPNTAMTAIVVRKTTNGSTTDTSFTGDITATWKATNKYGSLGGSTVVAAVAGVATFSNLVPSNVEGHDFVITFSASSVADVDTNPFRLWGTKLQNWSDFRDDLGGNAALPYAYDFRMNATIVGGAYSAVSDVLDDEGSRTPGDDLVQATSGSRPTVNNTIGLDASATLDGVDDYMTNALSATLKLIGSGGSPNPLNVWIVAKATGNGTIGGIVRDETSTAQNPFMVCKPSGGDWAFDLSTDGTGVSSHQTGTATPNFDFEYDANRRLIGMIKRPWNTDANIMGRFQCLVGGVPVAKHSRFPDATNANCKLVIGRHGTSYGAGEVCAIIVTNVEIGNVELELMRAFFEGEFGTLCERSNDPHVVMVNNSLGAGDTSTTELNGTNGSGTTTMMYYAANRNTGRGTFWAQFPLVANIHQMNLSHHGNTIPKMITDFDEDVSIYKETVRTGPTIVVMSEVLNTLNSGAAASLAALLDLVDDYYALCQAKGITFIMCTPPDARIFYTAGVINAIGTIAKDFTTELRANPNGVHCDHVIDLGYVGGVFEIDKVGTKSYENATYYNNPVSDGGHLIDAGQSAAGDIIKDFFDNNPGVLYPSNLPVLLNLRRQYAA